MILNDWVKIGISGIVLSIILFILMWAIAVTNTQVLGLSFTVFIMFASPTIFICSIACTIAAFFKKIDDCPNCGQEFQNGDDDCRYCGIHREYDR